MGADVHCVCARMSKLKRDSIVTHPSVGKAMRVVQIDGDKAQCAWPMTRPVQRGWFPIKELKPVNQAPIRVTLK